MDVNKRISVYIIEDDPDDQVLLKLAFESLGRPLLLNFASDCHHALTQLTSLPPAEQPDIIVSDYNTPLMNGEEFLLGLQAEPRYNNTPKVILSTAASPTAIKNCMARGATEYLVKPFSFDELTKVTRIIINLYKPVAG